MALCLVTLVFEAKRKKEKKPNPVKTLDMVYLKLPDNPQINHTLNFYVHLWPKLGKSHKKVTII